MRTKSNLLTGGNNAHASNIVAGIYLATGQDIAQAGTSAMAMVNMECLDRGDLYVSVTMPCIEVSVQVKLYIVSFTVTWFNGFFSLYIRILLVEK